MYVNSVSVLAVLLQLLSQAASTLLPDLIPDFRCGNAKIDAITKFSNNSMMVVSAQYFWVLGRGEVPTENNVKHVSDFFPYDYELQAAVNIKILADEANKKCRNIYQSVVLYPRVSFSVCKRSPYLIRAQAFTLFD